jgi:hypothetical protein
MQFGQTHLVIKRFEFDGLLSVLFGLLRTRTLPKTTRKRGTTTGRDALQRGASDLSLRLARLEVGYRLVVLGPAEFAQGCLHPGRYLHCLRGQYLLNLVLAYRLRWCSQVLT